MFHFKCDDDHNRLNGFRLATGKNSLFVVVFWKIWTKGREKKKKGGFQIFSCSVLRDKTVSTHAARTYWVIEFHKSYSIWKDYIIALLLNMYINTHNCKTTCDSVSVKLYLEDAGKSTTTAGWAYLHIIQFMSSCSRESLSSAELHLIPSDRLLWSGWLLCVRNKIKKKVISWIIKITLWSSHGQPEKVRSLIYQQFRQLVGWRKKKKNSI